MRGNKRRDVPSLPLMVFEPLLLAKLGGAALLVMAAALVEVLAYNAVRRFVATGHPHIARNAARWSERGITQAVAVVALVGSVVCSLRVGLVPVVFHGAAELWSAVAAVWLGAVAGTSAGMILRR